MDYDIFPGRSRENAKQALELAESRGFPTSSVRTTRNGYLIPADPEAEGGETIEAATPEEVTSNEDSDDKTEDKKDEDAKAGDDDAKESDEKKSDEKSEDVPTKTPRKRNTKKE